MLKCLNLILAISQYKNGTAAIDAFRFNVPNYTPLTHCTTAAIDLSESWLLGFNVNLPSGRGPVRISAGSGPLPVNLTNPYHFNQALIAAGHTPRTVDTALLVDPATNILKTGVRDPLLGANIPPSGSTDTGNTSKGKSASINVLANDSDPDGGSLSIASFDTNSAKSGTIARGKSAGVLVYTPASGFTGTDTFSYIVQDGSGGTQTVTVTVIVKK
ncbi:MAG: Ig-like domain-containing protein [Gammaproteobacteria bacterium]